MFGFSPLCMSPSAYLWSPSNERCLAGVMALAVCSPLVLVENNHCVITGDRVEWNEVAPAPIFFWYDFARAPSARTKKGLGIMLTVTMILVLALLLYGFW